MALNADIVNLKKKIDLICKCSRILFDIFHVND